jgi:hypothetical protein
MLKRAWMAALFALFGAALAGCNLQWALNLLFVPPPTEQQPGSFASFGVDVYATGSNLSGSIPGALMFQGKFQNAGWTSVAYATDTQVTASVFSQYDGSIDALYFDGHGFPGVASFTNEFQNGTPFAQQAWGVGNTSGQFPAGGTAQEFPLAYASNGIPVTGRLKWIFFNTSDTVAGPPSQDPAADWTANWRPAFGRPGGSLHGIYGTWQGPANNGCPGSPFPDRLCDLGDNNNIAFFFSTYALPTLDGSGNPVQGNPVLDSWQSALNSSGYNSIASAWEDVNARQDIISGPGNGSNPPSYTSNLSTSIAWYNVQNPNGIVVQPMAVSAKSVTSVAPHNLVNESINHAALMAQYGSGISGDTAVQDDGSTYSVRISNGATLKHFYGTSGGVVYSAPSPGNPVVFTQAAAKTAAVQFVNQTLGMPSDAVLSSTLQQWRFIPVAGTSTLMAYQFVWTHKNGMIGGDAMTVTVSDYQTSATNCTDWEPTNNDPPLPQKYCASWVTTYTDTPYITQGYRLWRSLGAANSALQSATSTLNASQAAASLPSGANITDYYAGYWTPDIRTSSSVGALSAWIFTLGGREQVAVNASNGKVLGMVANQ